MNAEHVEELDSWEQGPDEEDEEGAEVSAWNGDLGRSDGPGSDNMGWGL